MTLQNWTTKNIPSLTGKTIIVTGGNSGLGFEAVKAFAEKGATVIMACRDLKKGAAAKELIRQFNVDVKIELIELDLMDLSSVRSFVSEFKVKHQKLDVLLNNAGIMMVPYTLTKDGFESQLGTNHLGHFALTGLLLDLLKSTPHSRVVNVSSIAHKQGEMDYDNLLYDKAKGYTPLKAYGRSKLANLLFTFELQRYFDTNKIDCLSLAAHPGVSDTNLFNHIAPNWLMNILRPLSRFFIQPAEMGVLPELRAAVDKHAKGSFYYGPDGKREMKGFPVVVQPTQAAMNKESARKLWKQSEKLTGVVYPL